MAKKKPAPPKRKSATKPKAAKKRAGFKMPPMGGGMGAGGPGMPGLGGGPFG